MGLPAKWVSPNLMIDRHFPNGNSNNLGCLPFSDTPKYHTNLVTYIIIYNYIYYVIIYIYIYIY